MTQEQIMDESLGYLWECVSVMRKVEHMAFLLPPPLAGELRDVLTRFDNAESSKEAT